MHDWHLPSTRISLWIQLGNCCSLILTYVRVLLSTALNDLRMTKSRHFKLQYTPEEYPGTKTDCCPKRSYPRITSCPREEGRRPQSDQNISSPLLQVVVWSPTDILVNKSLDCSLGLHNTFNGFPLRTFQKL